METWNWMIRYALSSASTIDCCCRKACGRRVSTSGSSRPRRPTVACDGRAPTRLHLLLRHRHRHRHRHRRPRRRRGARAPPPRRNEPGTRATRNPPVVSFRPGRVRAAPELPLAHSSPAPTKLGNESPKFKMNAVLVSHSRHKHRHSVSKK